MRVVAQDDLSTNEVPLACRDVCAQIVELTGRCDREHDNDNNDNDAAEIACVCQNTTFQTSSVMALCASCINQNTPTNNDDDAREGMSTRLT